MWVSGGEELCVWNKDFQLQCQRQNHSDTGEEGEITAFDCCTNRVSPLTPLFAHQLINVVNVFWHFTGITALIELPKNCIGAAMDKEIGRRNGSGDDV